MQPNLQPPRLMLHSSTSMGTEGEVGGAAGPPGSDAEPSQGCDFGQINDTKHTHQRGSCILGGLGWSRLLQEQWGTCGTSKVTPLLPQHTPAPPPPPLHVSSASRGTARPRLVKLKSTPFDVPLPTPHPISLPTMLGISLPLSLQTSRKLFLPLRLKLQTPTSGYMCSPCTAPAWGARRGRGTLPPALGDSHGAAPFLGALSAQPPSQPYLHSG